LFKKRSSEVAIFQGVTEIIRRVHHAGHIICINTANSGEVVKMRVESAGFGSCISDISGSEKTGGKSEKIKALMQKHDFKTEDTYMIGDSLGDITEGKKAGVSTIGVGYGWQDPQLLKTASPDYLCMTVADLGELLGKIAEA
jgi:phosphoglycolate phosphatase